MRHLLVAFSILLPGVAVAQARPAPRAATNFWIAPYLGLGIQGKYYDGIVRFSDGGTDFLDIDPGTGVVFGVQFGYRVRPGTTFVGSLSTSSAEANYLEDGLPQPDMDFKTTQLEAGVLFQVTTFPVGGRTAPFSVGGGLSLTFHSLGPFNWSGEITEPSTTSVGLHGLALLDIPLGPRVGFQGQGKIAVISLSRGGLADALGAAESVGQPTPVTATLDGGSAMYFVVSAGLSIKL